MTYLEEELPLVFLITFLLLLLSAPSSLATISTRSPVSSVDEDEKEKNSQVGATQE